MGEHNIKLALVTGATAGIGKGVVRLLARNNVKVVMVGRSKEKLEMVKNEVGGDCEMVTCDMADREDIIRMAQSVLVEHGVPDLVVNNAGCYYFQHFADKDYASWQRMIDLNIMGYLILMAEFINPMKSRGSGYIVNITSDSQREAFPGLAVYTGTKFFWEGATQSIRSATF